MRGVGKTRFCRTCGAQVNLEDNFCPFCGSDITQKVYCRICGEVNPQGQPFCGYCGASLTCRSSPAEDVMRNASIAEQLLFADWEVPVSDVSSYAMPHDMQSEKKPEMTWKCRLCGARNDAQNGFCVECGAPKAAHRNESQKQSENLQANAFFSHVRGNETACKTTSSRKTIIGVILGLVACLALALFAIWKTKLWPVGQTDAPEEAMAVQETETVSKQDSDMCEEQPVSTVEETQTGSGVQKTAGADMLESDIVETKAQNSESLFGMLLADAKNAELTEIQEYSAPWTNDSNVASIYVPKTWLSQPLYGYNNSSHVGKDYCVFYFCTKYEAGDVIYLFKLRFCMEQTDTWSVSDSKDCYYAGKVNAENGQIFNAYILTWDDLRTDRVSPDTVETFRMNEKSDEEIEALLEYLKTTVVPTFSWKEVTQDKHLRDEELYIQLLQQGSKTSAETWSLPEEERYYMDASIQVPAAWLESDLYGFSENCNIQASSSDGQNITDGFCWFVFEEKWTPEYGSGGMLFSIEYFLGEMNPGYEPEAYCGTVLAGDGQIYSVYVYVRDYLSGAEELKAFLLQNVVPSFSGLLDRE